MTAKSTIAVAVVTYNSEHVIANCLERLGNPLDTEIVVLDNASTDNTIDLVQDSFPSVRIIESSENLGFAKAVNIVASSVNSDQILLLNPDALLDGETLRDLSRHLSEDSEAVAYAPLVRDPESEFFTIGAGLRPSIWRMFLHASGLSRLSGRFPLLRGHYFFNHDLVGSRTSVDWASGGCLLIKMDAWKRVGGLSERWFMYAEDVDLCLRLRAEGNLIKVDKTLTALHQVGGSSTNVDGRVGTVWIVNLFDLYKSSISRGLLHSGTWKLIVVGGFAGRSAVYASLSRLPGTKMQSRRINSLRFRLYATALWRESIRLEKREETRG
ncbi:glycosyltransferase family 2 protein [Agreia bicolorata]|uniref:glycosyltransferase family 2 protein n=1 Tax=Agreia bicolorata TaxID=110935 RepID=UPI0005C7F3A6|nr:glycosyltransferase family 2 protein [Agreia bicolorata]